MEDLTTKALECLEKLRGLQLSEMPFKDECGHKEVDLNELRIWGSQLYIDFLEWTNTIKQVLLQKQVSVDNNELLKELEMLHDCSSAMIEEPKSNWCEYAEDKSELDLKLYWAYEHIKQALIQGITDSACLDELQDKYCELKQTKSKKEQAWDIVKEMQLSTLNIIGNCNLYEDYLTFYDFKKNMGNPLNKQLTKEELNLLKEVMGE